VPDEVKRGRGRPPQVPPAPREPIGRERAGGPQRTPPPRRRPAAAVAPARPDLPPDVQSDLPPRLRKEIDRAISPVTRARDVKASLWLGSVAAEEGDLDRALTYLRWAKHLAPRLAVVREALGVVLYRADDLQAALSELQAYRRMSGSHDQNHLVADCMRASGRELERAVELGLELVDDAKADTERRIEAAIVVAAVLDDIGRRPRAQALMDRFLAGDAGTVQPDEESIVRLRWFAGELALRDGDDRTALAHLDALLALDPDYPDARERRAGIASRLQGG
jgi:tetratricopeptide (TPR) repeat protein